MSSAQKPRWEVYACGCGFDLGDRHDHFDTRQETVEWIEHLERQSDYTVRRVTSPTGQEWASTRLMETIEVPAE